MSSANAAHATQFVSKEADISLKKAEEQRTHSNDKISSLILTVRELTAKTGVRKE